MGEICEEQAFRIRRNLKDAGCGMQMILQFLELEQEHCRGEQYRLLACQKEILLKKMHCIQYKIDCLDHLVYTMRQEDDGEQESVRCKKQK